MKDFEGKVAVITGAASGIGRGIAEHCAQKEMKVVLADIEEGALRQAEQELRSAGATVLSVRTDVSRASDVEALAQKTLGTFGGVHLLFNNAGVSAGTTIWESTLADWQWVISVNLWGVIHGVRTFVPIMLQQNTECHIVNTSSMAGLTSAPGTGPYGVSKQGIASLSETLYFELKQRGVPIGISVLCPGLIRTRIFDCQRNRPIELQNPPVETLTANEREARMKFFREAMQSDYAMSPLQLAEVVFQAIQNNTFYIFSKPLYKEDVKDRMENILQDRSPTVPKHIP
jgi:NAD(P)-dependent dehydrogenase (short-subunit alcohol dehydrogenase family)